MDAKLIVSSRELKGTSNARRMRRAGKVPGVIYGEGGEARPVSVPAHEFGQILKHHSGEQMMIEIDLDGTTSSVLLKDVQHAPLSSDIIHVDLQEVSMTKKLKVWVSVELTGESEGVSAGGVLDHSLFSVEVECFPGDIVEKLDVDVSGLEIGDMLYVKDIPVDASKFTILTDGDIAIASVLAPRVAVEGEDDGEGSAEPEVISAKKEGAGAE
jgi:large subunit ribosomal protein L25